MYGWYTHPKKINIGGSKGYLRCLTISQAHKNHHLAANKARNRTEIVNHNISSNAAARHEEKNLTSSAAVMSDSRVHRTM